MAPGVGFTVGGPLTAAPSPLATAPAVIVPVGTIALVAPVTLAARMLDALVRVTALALYAVGVPVMGMVTTVPLVRCAAPAVSPAGRPLTVKLADVIDEAYVPLANVYKTLAPLTACPTFRLVSPVVVTAIAGVTAEKVAVTV